MSELFDLTGRTAIVVGAARPGGLGYAIAEGFCEAGASVALLDVMPEVEEVARTLGERTGAATASALVDVADADSVARAFDTVSDVLGLPTILTNSVGIVKWSDAVDMSSDDWSRIIDVNLTGSFHVSREFGSRVIAAGRTGSAILVSSMSGTIVNRPQNAVSYGASKAGITHLARSLAVEWATRGVRVNSISPGYFATDLTLGFMEQNRAIAQEWLDMIPVGRMGEPHELKGLAVYLASDASSYMTGQDLLIDGGYTSI